MLRTISVSVRKLVGVPPSDFPNGCFVSVNLDDNPAVKTSVAKQEENKFSWTDVLTVKAKEESTIQFQVHRTDPKNDELVGTTSVSLDSLQESQMKTLTLDGMPEGAKLHVQINVETSSTDVVDDWTLVDTQPDAKNDADGSDAVGESVDEEQLKAEPASDHSVDKEVLVTAPEDAPTPEIMSRVYVHIVGKLPDGTVFLERTKEEFDFLVGRGEVALGLQMGVACMKVGERSVLKCSESQGYSDRTRPDNVPKGVPLTFDVTLLRFEKEPNANELDHEGKLEFAESRRSIGKRLYSEEKFETAFKQYEKALIVLDPLVGDAMQGMNEANVPDDILERAKAAKAIHLTNMALCKAKLQDHTAVREFATKSIQLNPKNMKAYYRRAVALLQTNNYDLAIEDITKVLASPPDESSEKAARAVLAAAKKGLQVQSNMQKKQFEGMFRRELYPDKKAPPASEPDQAGSCWNTFSSYVKAGVDWVVSLCRKPKKD